MPSRISSLGAAVGSLKTASADVDAALHAMKQPVRKRTAAEEPPPRVFVTVSRQPGAGGMSFSHRLAERLNETDPAADWRAWDKELVERVGAEHGIQHSIVEMLEERPRSWLEDLLGGFAPTEGGAQVSEQRAYQYAAITVRALAQAGHAIIVGRGGVFITRNLPGGIHLRLVAPLEVRVRRLAEAHNLTEAQAAARAAELERAQAAFFHRIWGRKQVAPEAFTMGLNAGRMSVDEMVDAVLPLIRKRDAASRPKEEPSLVLPI
jgi:cytidylate kinase